MTTEHQLTKQDVAAAFLNTARMDAESIDEDVVRYAVDLQVEARRIAIDVQNGMGVTAHVGSTAEKLAVAVAQRDAAYKLIKRLEALV